MYAYMHLAVYYSGFCETAVRPQTHKTAGACIFENSFGGTGYAKRGFTDAQEKRAVQTIKCTSTFDFGYTYRYILTKLHLTGVSQIILQSTLLHSKVLLKETTKLQSRSGTVTPPPSPTSGQSLAPARAVLDVEGLATGTSEVCTATLEVLAHLFSWIDVSGSISTNLLDAIFSCAKYHDAMVGFYLCAVCMYK